MKNGNNPAYPCNSPDGKESYSGMTLREYFTAMAMQGLVSNGNLKEGIIISEMAVKIADQTIKELEKSNS